MLCQTCTACRAAASRRRSSMPRTTACTVLAAAWRTEAGTGCPTTTPSMTKQRCDDACGMPTVLPTAPARWRGCAHPPGPGGASSACRAAPAALRGCSPFFSPHAAPVPAVAAAIPTCPLHADQPRRCAGRREWPGHGAAGPCMQQVLRGRTLHAWCALQGPVPWPVVLGASCWQPKMDAWSLAGH